LYTYFFSRYGSIKSAKVSLFPDHKSKGYGYVWFEEEKSAKRAIEDSDRGDIPFKCCVYNEKGLEDILFSSNRSVIFKEFTKKFLDKIEVTHLFKAIGDINSVYFKEEDSSYIITFSDEVHAHQAVKLLNGKVIDGKKVQVILALTQKLKTFMSSCISAATSSKKGVNSYDNILFISNIDKEAT
jgi:RNA recognition motif-containing protein